ncbi:helix-turn-helix domain-containing protein [Streptomyces sp. NPDC097595]|uniref:AraC family transcriptional regulator n=1 Tax=Streptomyces sp. NPDC097595 TaxID=3366090 RepID=UPI00382CDC0E
MTSTILTRLSGHGFRRPGEVVALRQELVRPYRPHWHDFHEMALVTSGSGIHHVDGRTLPLTRGDVLVVSPSSLHAVAPAPGHRLELIDVTFDAQTMPRDVEKMLSTLTSGDPVVGQVPDPALFEALADETTGSRPHRQIMARALVSQVVVSLARDRTVPGGQRPVPPWLTQVLDHIERRHAEPLSVDELAAVAHLSPPYLRERFRAETGRTLTGHIQQVRLRTARVLLATTDLDISRIRRASGFGDPSHFARAFRAATGSSPTDYRAAAS